MCNEIYTVKLPLLSYREINYQLNFQAQDQFYHCRQETQNRLHLQPAKISPTAKQKQSVSFKTL